MPSRSVCALCRLHCLSPLSPPASAPVTRPPRPTSVLPHSLSSLPVSISFLCSLPPPCYCICCVYAALTYCLLCLSALSPPASQCCCCYSPEKTGVSIAFRLSLPRLRYPSWADNDRTHYYVSIA